MSELAQIAAEAGVQDIFVLRRVAPDRFFNVGGHGRGAGWAGNVSVDPAFEPWFAHATEQQITRKSSGVPFRVFGPYWSSSVAAVAVDGNLVVMGGNGAGEVDEELLMRAARSAAAVPADIPTEKLEADEAEVRQAIADFVAGASGDLDAAATHLAVTTARALSCEFAAVLLNGPPATLHLADEGWQPPASEEEVIAALVPLLQVVRKGMLVEQDLSQSAFPYRPLAFDDGLVARCAVPLGDSAELGLLVAAHAGTAPRGFTSLCQRVAREIAGAGEQRLAGLISLR